MTKYLLTITLCISISSLSAQKTDRFENKLEIVAYKTDILKQHESKMKIDTTLYDTEPSILDDFMLFDNDISSYDLSTIEFISLKPIAVGNLFKTFMNR